MKFALALLAFSAVNAVEVETTAEIEGGNYGGHGGYGSYSRHGHTAVNHIHSSYTPVVRHAYVKTYNYNGHGHHSDSSSSSSDSSYDSHDYSSSDYGYGYRHHHGRHRYYRYTPKYHSGRYVYGHRYASHGGHYKAAYRSYRVRSYTGCHGCSKPSGYGS